jgi:uncharacterized protein (TIGR02996 family)
VLETFLRAILDDPRDTVAWQAMADWLEEDDQPLRAELVRLREALTRAILVDGRPAKERRLRELLLSGVAPVVPLWDVELPGKVALPLALIPAGSFLMGSPDKERNRLAADEGPRQPVRIGKPFLLGTCPVTQAQWQALMGKNPARFRGDDRPVENVNYTEAQLFCERLAGHVGRACRLPTEAEWEYACRAGNSGSFHTGEGVRAARLAGWCTYRGQSGGAGETKPVGQFLANGFGLYDMHGNVREWCLDDLRKLGTRLRVDPRGTLRSDYRVVRGGSWYYNPEDSRAASRYRRPTGYRLDYYGFRVLVAAE